LIIKWLNNFRHNDQRQSRQNVCSHNALIWIKGAAHRNKKGLRCAAPLIHNLVLNSTDVLAALPQVDKLGGIKNIKFVEEILDWRLFPKNPIPLKLIKSQEILINLTLNG